MPPAVPADAVTVSTVAVLFAEPVGIPLAVPAAVVSASIVATPAVVPLAAPAAAVFVWPAVVWSGVPVVVVAPVVAQLVAPAGVVVPAVAAVLQPLVVVPPVVPLVVLVVPLSSLSAFLRCRLVAPVSIVSASTVTVPPVPAVVVPPVVLAAVLATAFSRIALCPARPWIHFMAWGLSSTIVAPFNFVESLTTVQAADYHVRVIAHLVDSSGTSFNFLLKRQQPLHCYPSKLKGAASAEPPTHDA